MNRATETTAGNSAISITPALRCIAGAAIQLAETVQLWLSAVWLLARKLCPPSPMSSNDRERRHGGQLCPEHEGREPHGLEPGRQ
jgi:hypothetical protein